MKGIFLFLVLLLLPCNIIANEIPVAILSSNGDSTRTLTFTYAEESTATASGGEDGTYKLNRGETTPGWIHSVIDYSITTVVFDASFAKAKPTVTFEWFYNLAALKTIKNIKYLNTSNVTNMCLMFGFCRKLTSLDVSGFNTQNVTDMSDMFVQCVSLTSLDVSGFNTQNVTDMQEMFNDCSGLTSLDVSGFNTQNVTNMSRMFSSCSGLTSLDVSGFNTQNVTNMSRMFSGSGLTSLDVSGFKTENVTSMASMFANCMSLTSLDLSGFNTQNVTDMNRMFYRCSSLTSLDLSGFNTENVTDITNMFSNCTALKKIDLGNNDFKNVDNRNNYVFYNVGIASSPCLLLINSSFDKSVLGNKIENNSISYYTWLNGFFYLQSQSHNLSIKCGTGGYVSYNGTSVSNNSRSFTIEDGSNAQLTITPNSGYNLSKVTINGVDKTASVQNGKLSVNVDKDISIVVTFAKQQVYRNFSIQCGTGGTVTYNGTSVSNSSHSFTIEDGSNVQLTITPNSGYNLSKVTINGVDKTASVQNGRLSVNVEQDINVVVTFIKQQITHTLSIKSSANGYITFSGYYISNDTRSFTVDDNTNATLTVMPNSNYKLSSLIVNGNNVTSDVSNNQYTIRNITQDISVSASFESTAKNYRTVTFIASGNGIIDLMDNNPIRNGSKTMNASGTIPIRLTPDNGNSVLTFTVNGNDALAGNASNVHKMEGAANTYYIDKGTDDLTISVTFGVKKYDFYVGGLYYNITSNSTVEVTSLSKGVGVDQKVTYTGDIVIPTTVTYNGTTYNVTRIGKEAFNASIITSISIPESVTSIGDYAFSTSMDLKEITIPASVTSVGEGLFFASQLDKITCLAKTPPTVPNNNYLFRFVSNSPTLYVPQGCTNKYRSATGWSRISNIVELSGEKYSVSINVSGNGSVSYKGSTIRNRKYTNTAEEGDAVTLSFTPDAMYEVGKLIMNNSDVTSSIANNQYTVTSISGNLDFSVTFTKKKITSITSDGMTYQIKSEDSRTLTLSNVGNKSFIDIPSSLSYEGSTWTITGISKNAFNNNERIISVTVPSSVISVDDNTFSGCNNMAAIVWNASMPLTNAIIGSGLSDNLLIYVKSAYYAPSRSQNVVVNGTADNVVLADATMAKSNNFYCPQAFKAKKITYQHRYSMQTAIGKCQGWETIALPFDVQNIKHESKGEITPFSTWNGNSGKPFWLYEMTANGWRHSSSIKANTPYIISMPNCDDYDEAYNLSGTITFSAENVTVKVSDDIVKTKYNGRTFIPNFTTTGLNSYIYVLNAINDFASNRGGYDMGSHFVRSLRTVYPFEAYMSTSDNAAKANAFDIDINTATDIQSIVGNGKRLYKIYNLQGQLVKEMEATSATMATKGLPIGIYIVNGRKITVK